MQVTVEGTSVLLSSIRFRLHRLPRTGDSLHQELLYSPEFIRLINTVAIGQHADCGCALGRTPGPLYVASLHGFNSGLQLTGNSPSTLVLLLLLSSNSLVVRIQSPCLCHVVSLCPLW